MSDSIKFIGDRAFENCVNLESVCLSKNALRIGNQAFRNCVKLKHFDIYPSLLVLGENCFQGCAALETIRYHGNLHQFRNIAIGISIKNIRIVTDDGSVFI